MYFFSACSNDLCNSLALVARKICTTYVDPQDIAAFTANRLIALDKCPGVRPIGVGETVRRIISKAVLSVIKSDVLEAAGSHQLCAGHEAGCEASIHSMCRIFHDTLTEAVLLVDANNAFNSLNRKVALLNIHQLCPSLATILTNTYRENASLFIDGDTLFSQEGTTQGDPLAMAMYAVATVPLIEKLQNTNTKQVWYADDATAGGTLLHLKAWWTMLSSSGPSYGYFVNPGKTWLIVKPQHEHDAKELFSGTGIGITSEGKRHLGAALGNRSFLESYINNKVKVWTSTILNLSLIAKTPPHAAYCAFVHGVSGLWTFFLRTIPDISSLLQPLEDAVRLHFIPSITGRDSITVTERDIFALPARLGGLAIPNPIVSAPFEYSSSVKITAPLVSCIMSQCMDLPHSTLVDQKQAKATIHSLRQQLHSSEIVRLKATLAPAHVRSMALNSEQGASSWLSVLPISDHGFALHKGAFHDAMCLRYNWQRSNLPSHCVCGSSFTTDHALTCPTGGFPSVRHNDLRDFTANLLTEVCPNVCVEPPLQALTGELMSHQTSNSEDGARLDISAQGFWGDRHQRVFFYVRVFHPNAPSYRNMQLPSAYRLHERQKQRSYDQRIKEVEHGSFTPLVFSTSGGMGKCASVTYKRIATLLSTKREQTYGATIAWIRCCISFSLLRSAIMCLRGARSSQGRPFTHSAIDLAVSEAKVPTFV